MMTKLAWANLLSMVEVFETFIEAEILAGPDIWTWSGPRALSDLEALCGGRLDAAHTSTLAGFVRQPEDLIAIQRGVRYCPVCLEHAFHSVLFQVKSVERCPAHAVPLVDRCTRCSAQLAYSFGDPGCCAVCGLRLFEMGTDWPTRFRRSVAPDAFRALAQECAGKGSDEGDALRERVHTRPLKLDEGPFFAEPAFWERHPNNLRLVSTYFEAVSALSLGYLASTWTVRGR